MNLPSGVVLGVAALAAFVVSPSDADQHRAGQKTMEPGLVLKIECRPAGTPVEFPSGLAFRNLGTARLKKGTVVSWSVAGRNGDYTLEDDLGAGRTVFKGGLVTGGVEAGRDCQAVVKRRPE